MTEDIVTKYLEGKIKKNENYIIITFFELRVKSNFSEEETKKFLKIAKTKLEIWGYKVYFTGEKYFYKFQNMIVQENELMVGIKEN